jgi:GNAT superfamily N-acetyltransferase
MAHYEVRPFTADDLDEAGRLLSERHRHQRRQIFALDRRFELPAAAREQVAALFEKPDASGAIVALHGRAVAYVLGAPRADQTWGPNVWIEDAGSGGTDVEAIREAYAAAAGIWVTDEKRTKHFVIAPATDTQALDAWFSLGFGKQQVHALREPVWREFEPTLKEGLSVRRAERRDVPVLAEIDVALPLHQSGTAVFSPLPVPDVKETEAELEAEFDDPKFATFVAEHEGEVIGAAIGCSLEVSPGHTALMRPRSCGFLGFASVLPSGRGLGAGRALGETVMCWSRDEGYEWMATDWRSTNLQSNRTWLALGFKPSFQRLHRAIV